MLNKTRIRRKWAQGRRGAAVVEMAFVAPIFFVLILVLVEFGRMVMVQQAITNAAREGCRHAALATTQSRWAAHTKVRDLLTNTLPNANDSSEVRIDISPTAESTWDDMESGVDITATVEVDYADVTWMPTRFLGDVVLGASSTMKRE